MGTAGATELSKSAKAWHKNYSSASTSIIRTRMTPTRANITMYDNGGTLGFLDIYWQQNNIQPQLVAGAVLRLALGKWGVHTPLQNLFSTFFAGYDTAYMLIVLILLIYSFHSVCLWFSATLCSQDATSEDTSPLYRVTITVPIRPIMNWGWHGEVEGLQNTGDLSAAATYPPGN